MQVRVTLLVEELQIHFNLDIQKFASKGAWFLWQISKIAQHFAALPIKRWSLFLHLESEQAL